MPGPIISHYLTTCSQDAFDDLAHIFRHDFVLYAGMLHSWTTLFEHEIPPTHTRFLAMTRRFKGVTGQFLEDVQPRLYPQYLAPAPDEPCHQHLCAWWDRYYYDLNAYTRPRMAHLSIYLRTYVTYPDFIPIIQANLGPAANHERIDKLLLSAYNKLQQLFDARHFDRRIETVLNARQIARAG
jgi:hypothetical protein